MKYLSIAVILCLHSLSYSVSAKDVEIPEIIVTAKENQPISSSLATAIILSKDDIRRSQTTELPQLLNRSAGISATDTGGRGSVTGLFLRGASASQTLVLVDGVRVGSASLGLASLNGYPIESIERIEVIKGPFSGLYGADAVGGVIHLFTSADSNKNNSIEVNLGSDSLEEFTANLSFSGKNSSWNLGYHNESLEGIDRTSLTNDGNDDLDGYDEESFSLTGKIQLNHANELNLTALLSENHTEFDNTFGADLGSFTETTNRVFSLNHKAILTDQWRLTTRIGLNQEDTSTPVFFSEIDSTRLTLDSEARYEINDANHLTFGFNYYDEDIDTSSEFNENGRDNLGGFLQFRSALLPGDEARIGALNLLTSLRYDDNSAYGTDTNYSIGADYQVTQNVRAILNYGTAFSAPSFNFLFFPNFGNPDLVPEESESIELSFAGLWRTIDWRLSFYKTDIENLFASDPSTFTATNIGEAELEGVELTASTNLFNWTLDFNFNLSSATNKVTNVELDDRPEKTAFLGIQRQFDKWHVRFDVTAEDGRFDLRGVELPSYALFSVGVEYKLNDNISFNANLDNVFDKNYTVNLISTNAFYNTKGRQANIRIRYGF